MSRKVFKDITIVHGASDAADWKVLQRSLPHRACVKYTVDSKVELVEIEVGSETVNTLAGISYLKGRITKQAAENLFKALEDFLAGACE